MIYKVTDDKEVMAAAEAAGLNVERFLDGKHAAVEVPAEKPKIKMTKELPSDKGSYFWAPEAWCEPVMGEIDCDGDFDSGLCTEKPETMGGYWAKVDQSMFEFEG